MKEVILITGASSGFGLLSAQALAKAGHFVYASMRETRGRNAPQIAAVEAYAKDNELDLRTVELDVASEDSTKAGVEKVIADNGRLDVIVHNAGHMVFGPAEAFTPGQYAELYDINVLSTQRVNRAALPQLRKQGRGLLVWVSSSSARRRNAAFSRSLFCGEGSDGLAGRNLCKRGRSLGDRDVNHRSGCLHEGHQPFRPRW
jgi:NAD(P)-dependent dehydrogenase (short-subunit alcohol dehydrogenase family)